MVSQKSLPSDILKALRRFAGENPDIYAAYYHPSGKEREPTVQFVTPNHNQDLDIRIINFNVELTRQDDNLYLTILQIQMPQEVTNSQDLGRRFYSRN